MKRPLKVGLAAALLVIACGWLVLRWLNPPFVSPALPEPNGYDELLRAAEMLAPRTGFYDEMDEAELTAIVEHNRPALELARKALNKECGVPVNWTRDLSTGFDPNDLERSKINRQLCRAFSAEMRDNLAHGRSQEAVFSGLAALQLGHKCGNGGLIVDYLVSLAVQGKAIEELRQVIAHDPSLRGEILQGVLSLPELGEPAEAVIKREEDFIRSALRGIQEIMIRRQFGDLVEPAVKSTREAGIRTLAKDRLFVTHLAVQSFQAADGVWPKTLSELSPAVLEKVPLDPYINAPFVYRVEEPGYRLYSVGRNGKDDGGDGDESGLAPDVTFDLTAPVE